MARRARKGVEPLQIIIIIACVAAAGALVFFLKSRSTDQFASLTPLPVGEYMRNANSLSGNVYKMSGTVTSSNERYTENNGKIIIVEVEDGGSLVDLGVYVPVELYGTNIDRGDTITSKVEVRAGGILALQEIR